MKRRECDNGRRHCLTQDDCDRMLVTRPRLSIVPTTAVAGTGREEERSGKRHTHAG